MLENTTAMQTILDSLKLPQKGPSIMGIVNLSPDSFSDGGRYNTPLLAGQHIQTLIKDGADIIDIGAESTRPGAAPISADEEISRLRPILDAYNYPTPLSIDTSKASVAKWALDHGATMINDVAGLRDPDMGPILAEANCPVVIMHMKGTPLTMQNDLRDDNIVDTIMTFFEERIQYATTQGITKIILDPGIGFGKTAEQNLRILNHLRQVSSFGFPVLIGTSNKSFIGDTSGAPVDERLPGTLVSNILAIENGAKICRVHNVKALKQALCIKAAIEEPI